MSETIKVLSLLQPWASAIAHGLKQIETRSWATSYRGPVAIHASAKFPRFVFEHLCGPGGELQPFLQDVGLTCRADFPTGVIVAVCNLAKVIPTEHLFFERKETGPAPFRVSLQEQAFGDYSDRRYAWVLKDVRPLSRPVPAKGSLGLWEFPISELGMEVSNG